MKTIKEYICEQIHIESKDAIYKNCAIQMFLINEKLLESDGDKTETETVKELMKNPENWEKNNYGEFFKSLKKNPLPTFLTQYTIDDFKKANVTTYKLKDYNIGFALKPDQIGFDIISIHNSEENVHNIIDSLFAFAKECGGNHLDNFSGLLSSLYERNNFKVYKTEKWNDKYAPEGWDYERFGKPNVEYRKLEE